MTVDGPTNTDIFQSTSLFSSLSREDVDLLLSAMTRRAIPEGMYLFVEGRPGDSMALIVQGAIRVSVKKPDGSLEDVARLNPGDMVGELACLDPAPRSATATAIKETIVYELSRTMLIALRKNAPRLAIEITRGITRMVTERIRNTNASIEARLTGESSADKDSDNSKRPANTPEESQARATAYGGPVDLPRIPGFGALTRADLSVLQSAAPPALYLGGTNLCVEGKPGASCFIIAKGEVEVRRFINGRQTVLATLKQGAMVGQMSLIDSSPRSATIQAHGDVVALELGRDVFEQLINAKSPLAMRFQEEIAVVGTRQLRHATARLATLTTPRDGKKGGSPYDFEHVRRIPRTGNTPDAPTAPNTPPTPKMGDSSKEMLQYIRTALGEWGMSLSDLDKIQAARPDGQMSGAEERARKNRGY